MRIGGLSDLFPVKKKSLKKRCIEIGLLAAALYAIYYGSGHDWRLPAVLGPMLLVFVVVDVVRSNRRQRSGEAV